MPITGVNAQAFSLVCCSGHLKEMHCPKQPYVAFLSHPGSVLGYKDWTNTSFYAKMVLGKSGVLS